VSEKSCTVCKKLKPLDAFSPCREGRQPSCKECRNFRARNLSIPVTVAEQKCYSCKQMLPASEFNRAKHRKSGLQHECKACTSARKKSASYPVTLSEKTCCDCGLTKPAKDFPRDTKRVGGLRKECRDCSSVRTRASVYKLSFDACRKRCDVMACDICKEGFSSPSEKNIDHCHKTGRVRGTLCGGCNRMLGGARDNPLFLSRAIHYLAISFRKTTGAVDAV
jgi:hypothetical protein